jgi:hypothetical protein
MALLIAAGLDKIGVSGFYNFKQELSIPVHFVWQHILATPLENQLLQARQA